MYALSLIWGFYQRTFMWLERRVQKQPVRCWGVILVLSLLLYLGSELLEPLVPSWVIIWTAAVFIGPYVFAFVLAHLRKHYF